MIKFSALCAVVLMSLAGCGDAALGESCGTSGTTEGCAEDTICTNGDDGNYCRKPCTEQSDCGANEDCNGISGSNTKSCQPKKDAPDEGEKKDGGK